MGYMGLLLIIYPKPYSIYLRGTIRFRGQGPGFKGIRFGFRVRGLGLRVQDRLVGLRVRVGV